MDPREVEEMRQRIEETERRQQAALRVPKFATRVILHNLQVPQPTLINWLGRDIFKLDADKHRASPTAPRLFSARDVLLIATANNFVILGLPISKIKFVAEYLVEGLGHLFRPKMNALLGPTLLLFVRDDEWIMATEPFDPSGSFAAKVLTADGTWRNENLTRESIPSTFVTFRPEAFFKDTLEKLGEGFFVGGTADQIRQQADTLDAKHKARKRSR